MKLGSIVARLKRWSGRQDLNPGPLAPQWLEYMRADHEDYTYGDEDQH
jgi:hypothetical protein